MLSDKTLAKLSPELREEIKELLRVERLKAVEEVAQYIDDMDRELMTPHNMSLFIRCHLACGGWVPTNEPYRIPLNDEDIERIGAFDPQPVNHVWEMVLVAIAHRNCYDASEIARAALNYRDIDRMLKKEKKAKKAALTSALEDE